MHGVTLPNGTRVHVARLSSRRYVLRWRTPRMPAPAFWYFRTHRQALDAACALA